MALKQILLYAYLLLISTTQPATFNKKEARKILDSEGTVIFGRFKQPPTNCNKKLGVQKSKADCQVIAESLPIRCSCSKKSDLFSLVAAKNQLFENGWTSFGGFYQNVDCNWTLEVPIYQATCHLVPLENSKKKTCTCYKSYSEVEGDQVSAFFG